MSAVSEEIFHWNTHRRRTCEKRTVCVQSSASECDVSSLEADSEEQVSVKADENSGVAWFTPEEALKKSTEPWFVERVYAKLIKKTRSQSEAEIG